MREYELKLPSGTVRWDGRSGEDACRRYVAAHPGSVVVAWRHAPHGLSFWGRHSRVIEPGDRAWR